MFRSETLVSLDKISSNKQFVYSSDYYVDDKR